MGKLISDVREFLMEANLEEASSNHPDVENLANFHKHMYRQHKKVYTRMFKKHVKGREAFPSFDKPTEKLYNHHANEALHHLKLHNKLNPHKEIEDPDIL